MPSFDWNKMYEDTKVGSKWLGKNAMGSEKKKENQKAKKKKKNRKKSH